MNSELAARGLSAISSIRCTDVRGTDLIVECWRSDGERTFEVAFSFTPLLDEIARRQKGW